MVKRSDDIVWHGPGGAHDSHREYVRAMGCLLSTSECAGMIVVHHVLTRACGGTYKDLVPLCRGHHTGWRHDWQTTRAPAFPVHGGRKTFTERYDIDLPAEAARLLREHFEEE